MRRVAALAFAITLLAACNSGDRREAGPTLANVASERSPAMAPVNAQEPPLAKVDEIEFQPAVANSPVDPTQPTRSWFAGRWSDTGDCAQAGEFAGNGTYLLADGTRGMWNVIDGKLIVQHAAGRATVRLRKLDETNVEVISEDGSVGRSTRC